MSERINLVVRHRSSAHEAITRGYELAKLLIANDKPVRIHIGEDEEDITVKQRAFFHAAVLPQIAEQVFVEGHRYSVETWKELLKQLFIPDKWDMVRLPFVLDRKTGLWKPSRKKVPVKRRKSTEELSIKQYAEFIDKSIGHAASEWGVQFHFIAEEREAVRYVAPVRKRKEQREEVPA